MILFSSVKYSGKGSICSGWGEGSVYLIWDYFLKHVLVNFGIRIHWFKKEFWDLFLKNKLAVIILSAFNPADMRFGSLSVTFKKYCKNSYEKLFQVLSRFLWSKIMHFLLLNFLLSLALYLYHIHICTMVWTGPGPVMK